MKPLRLQRDTMSSSLVILAIPMFLDNFELTGSLYKEKR